MVTENVNIIVTTRGARVAQSRIRGIGTSSRTATFAVRALGVALAALAGARGIAGLVRLSDTATEVGNRIRTVTSSTEVFLSVQERLFDVASKTGGSIEDTARLFQRLSVGTRDLGVGTARVVNVVEGLNAALVVSGSTAREASAALLQLGQGLASDNLSGEELRSLRENLPQLAQELADVLDKPIGALKEMGRQGLLNAETVFPALEIAVEKFQEKLKNGEIIFTFAQAWNAVRNAVVKAVTIIQRATGLTQDLTKAIFDMSDGLAEKLVRGLANTLDFVASIIDGFSNLKRVMIGLLPAVGALVNAFGFFGKVGVIAVQGVSLAFNALLVVVASLNGVYTQLLRLIGKATKEDVLIAAAGIESSVETVGQDFEQLQGLIDKFGDSSFLELALGLDGVGASASKAGDLVRGLARGLREAAATPPPKKDDEDVTFDFFQRAARRETKIATERDTKPIDLPTDLSERISTSFRDGFAGAIQNGDDFFGAFKDNLETASTEALVQSLQKGFDVAESLLSEAFQSAVDAMGPALESVFGDSAGALGQALQGALQFAALQGLSALLGGAGNKTSGSSANVESAVTSTQAVRGIVAGPQEIAIANIGRNLAEVIAPLLAETQRQTTILTGILAVNTTGSAATSDLDALAFGGAPPAAV